jgi:hypothetical protein
MAYVAGHVCWLIFAVFNDVLDDIVSSSSDDSDYCGEADSRGMSLHEDLVLLEDYDNIDMEALLGTVGVSPSDTSSIEGYRRNSNSSGRSVTPGTSGSLIEICSGVMPGNYLLCNPLCE